MKRLAMIWLVLALLVVIGQVTADTWTGYPNGVGDRTEATPNGAAANWDCCDETPPDDETTFISTAPAVSPDEDLYALTDPTFDPTDFINSVTVYIRSKRATSGDAQPCFKENGTDTVGSAVGLTAVYANYSQTWTARASDGNNWQYDDIVALQAGVKQAASSGATITTAVYVVVDYTPSIKPQVIIITGDD